MNTENTGSLAALVQGQIDSDTDFQATLANLSDDEKTQKINEKRDELYESSYSNLVAERDKQSELAGNYKTRAEKAEQARKEREGNGDGNTPNNGAAAQNESTLTQKDWLVLAKADVHEDDIDDVVEYARFAKIDISKALSSTVIKSILAEKAEARKAEVASNIKGGKPGAHKRSDADVYKDAQNGKMPKPGTPEAEALFRARRGLAEDTKV